MRTMLISLALFCSLTQLAIASEPPAPPEKGSHKSLKGCGSIYTCYIPEKCKDNTKSITASTVDIVHKESEQIYNDCPAIIRIHVYTTKWIHVEIESLAATTETIEFYQKAVDDPSEPKSADFSCKRTEDASGKKKVIATYSGKLKDVQVPMKNNSEKIKCELDVKLTSSKKAAEIISDSSNAVFTFIINTVKTVNTESGGIKHNCNPSNLKYSNEKKKFPEKVYKQVRINPGKYDCEHPYKLEYRKEGASDYKTDVTITCNSRSFMEGGERIGKNVGVDIRCVSDAHFFCNNDVKPHIDKPKPIYTPADLTTSPPKESKMKCDNARYLVVVGEGDEKSYKDAKIQCLNFYKDNEPVWAVVNSTGQTVEILTEEGPVVYCTNELDCKSKITESSVVDGTLDTKMLPTCFDSRGTLHVMHEGERKPVKETKCDRATGEFKYTIETSSNEHVIDEGVKFVCEYPKEEDTEKNQKNKEKIYKSGYIAIGIAAAIALAMIGATFYFSFRRVKKENEKRKKRERENKAAWQKYCVDGDEKKAYNKAHEMESEESVEAPGESWNWSPMLMSFQHNAMRHMMQEVGNALKYVQINREQSKIEFTKTKEDALKCAQIYKCMFPGEDQGKDTPERRTHRNFFRVEANEYWEDQVDENPRKRRFDNIIET